MIYLLREITEQGGFGCNRDYVAYSKKKIYSLIESSDFKYYRIYQVWYDIKATYPEVPYATMYKLIDQKSPNLNNSKCVIKKSKSLNELFRRECTLIEEIMIEKILFCSICCLV